MIRAISCITRYLLCCIFANLYLSVSAQANTIIWQTDHRPPASILKAPYQGQGFIDTIRDELIEQLPQYQHIRSVSSLDRLFEEMNQGKEICHPLLFVTEERKKNAYFSIAATITPSMRLVMRADVAQALYLKEPINLEQFISNTRETFAIVKGRSYGPVIDSILALHNSNDNHVKINVSDNTTLFKLLEKNRVDFTFAYPFELNYYRTHNPNTQFKMFTIQGEADYTLGSVACSKTAWGKSAIENINSALRKQRQQDNFISTISYWWPEETTKQEFKDFYQNVFLTK
ncbi:TIGR02285 family protein [Cognaticolwellia mytili]|uniref:TIGR02285 family protein n=1 Tax=Cognaticolwellia mytili TaxID=1888913 RepID=UPI000A1735A9|nr:TIGR02285 family protein [Cognaticolwellia mytili]